MKASKTLLLFSLLVSCIGDEGLEIMNIYDCSILFFLDELSLEEGSRGTPITSVTQMSSVGVFATLSEGEYASSEDRSAIMYNVELQRSGETWSYSPTQQWSNREGEYTSFFAYAPYVEEGVASESGVELLAGDGDGTPPSIRYTMPLQCEDQPDLMVAMPCFDMVRQTGCVELLFHHALAALSFSVEGAEELEVLSIEVRGFIAEATLSLSESKVTWGDYGEVVDRSYYPTKDDYLMAIPQSTDGVVISVVVEDCDEQSEREYTLSGGGEWCEGFLYNYIIDLDEDELTYSFEEVANCYMLDPTSYNTFYIPIDERVNDFWSNYSGVGSHLLSDYLIDSSSDWAVTTLWCDLLDAETEQYLSITKASAAEMSRLDSSAEAMLKVKISSESVAGNILVGVTKQIDNTTTILWSWHLWVTNYAPSQHSYAPTTESGAYAVTGGEIHRYSDSEWCSGGTYEGKFIMDRNIGALTSGESSTTTGALYYQWGRKDPLLATTTCRTTTSSTASFAETVMNPTTFYCEANDYSSYGWCNESNFVTTDARRYLWCDINALNPLVDGVTPQKEKSIFDPSPAGWRLPLSSIFDSTYVSFSSGWYDSIAYYPYLGRLNYGDGDLESFGSGLFMWFANPDDDSYYSYMLYVTSYFGVCWTLNRANGMAVRCIEE